MCFLVLALESFIKPDVKVASPVTTTQLLHTQPAGGHNWGANNNSKGMKKKKGNHAALRLWRPADWPTAGSPSGASGLKGEELKEAMLKVSG